MLEITFPLIFRPGYLLLKMVCVNPTTSAINCCCSFHVFETYSPNNMFLKSLSQVLNLSIQNSRPQSLTSWVHFAAWKLELSWTSATNELFALFSETANYRDYFLFFWSAIERVPESESQRRKQRRQLISEFEIPKSYSNFLDQKNGLKRTWRERVQTYRPSCSSQSSRFLSDWHFGSRF